MDKLSVGDMSHFVGTVDREQTFLLALMKEILFLLTDGGAAISLSALKLQRRQTLDSHPHFNTEHNQT